MNEKEYREREKIYACWLCNFPDVGSGKRHKLSELCGGPEGVYFAGKEKWAQVLSEKQVKALAEFTKEWRPEAEYRNMLQQGIWLLNSWDKEYPQCLAEMSDKPYGLFVKGKLPGSEVPTVAIIGARDCSEYGGLVAKELGAFLGRNGIPVISGMARGIDGLAQEAALNVGGTSVAVLGSGVDVCYPPRNRAIYERLVQEGAVISEYPLGTGALAMNFPIRNRIVSGLADAVVVVEARIKSGTLITVDMALEQGREVYVVPGRITDRLSDGCNRLLKQGAALLLSPEEFLEELWELWERKKERLGTKKAVGEKMDKDTIAGEQSGQPVRISAKSIKEKDGDGFSEKLIEMKEAAVLATLTPEKAAIYKVLDETPKTVDDILKALPPKYQNLQITTHLMWLCMQNRAIQVTPGHFCRKLE